jgi:hypothetical protein
MKEVKRSLFKKINYKVIMELIDWKRDQTVYAAEGGELLLGIMKELGTVVRKLSYF